MVVYLAGIRFAFAPEGISSSSHCPCGPRTNLIGGMVSPSGKNDSADSATNSARGRSPGGYPQSRPSSKATRNRTPLNCPLNSNAPAYFASSAAGSVTAFLVSARSAGQLYRSAAPRTSSFARFAPLSPFVITTIPSPDSRNITKLHLNPSLDPPCPNRRAAPSPSIMNPRPYSPFCTLSISRADALSITLFDSPRDDLQTSIANRARSPGVVQRPAGAISGYVCQRPSTIFPSP